MNGVNFFLKPVTLGALDRGVRQQQFAHSFFAADQRTHPPLNPHFPHESRSARRNLVGVPIITKEGRAGLNVGVCSMVFLLKIALVFIT